MPEFDPQVAGVLEEMRRLGVEMPPVLPATAGGVGPPVARSIPTSEQMAVELANMLRGRDGPRMTPVPPHGQALWDTPPEVQGPPGLYDQAIAEGKRMHENVGNLDPVEVAMGTIAPYAMGRFPRAAGALWGAYGPGLIPTPAQGAEKGKAVPDPEIKALQQELRKKGHDVEMDGIAGPKTQRAMEKERDYQQKQQELELQKQGTANTQKKQELEALQTKLAADREKEMGEAGKRSAERYRQQSDPTFLETWGPWLGLGVGTGLGYGERMLAHKGIKSYETGRAARANELVGEMGTGSVSDRSSRVNQFYTEGGSAEPPFNYNSRARGEAPYTSNPGASRAQDLYQRGPGLNYGPGGFGAAAGAGELGLGGYWAHQARQERMAAEADYQRLAKEGGTDAQFVAAEQRILKARHWEAIGDSMIRAGQGTLGGTAAGEVQSRFHGGAARPAVGRAEAERAAIEAELAAARRRPRRDWELPPID